MRLVSCHSAVRVRLVSCHPAVRVRLVSCHSAVRVRMVSCHSAVRVRLVSCHFAVRVRLVSCHSAVRVMLVSCHSAVRVRLVSCHSAVRVGLDRCHSAVRVGVGYVSLSCSATFVIRFPCTLLLAFSLHFSSSSAFPRSLFTQSSHPSCGLPRFLKPSCFFVSDHFGDLSSCLMTMRPAQSTRFLNLLSHDLRITVGSLSRLNLSLPQYSVPDVLHCMSGRLSGFPSLY